MFFVFDGIDGSGKSTQSRLFANWLAAQGREVVACRDPGSTALGDQLRALLLHDRTTSISRVSEMLLYMAARAQLVEEVIRPALEAGKCVVSDRYLLANVVYQGHGGGLDVEQLWQIGRVATQAIEPAITFLLDIDPTEAARRMQRPLDRMESQGHEFRQRVREGFLAEARRRPEAIRVVQADRSEAAIQEEIRAAAQALLAAPHGGQRPTPSAARSP